MGGLPRRAYLIKQFAGEKDKPTLTLDAGALLFEHPVITPSQLEAKKVKAEGIIRSLQSMKYDAIGIASHDLTAGAQFLKQLEDTFNIPFLSINLTAEKSKELLFKPYQIFKTGDVSIAVIGLTGIEPGTQSTAPLTPRDYSVTAWPEALQKTLNEVRPKADMVILLSSFSEQKNREIAKGHPGIHLILQSGHSAANRPPTLYTNTLITQIGSRGKFQGKMDINWTQAGKWEQDFSTQLKQVQDRLDRVKWQIGRLEKKYKNKSPSENVQYNKLQQLQSDLVAEMEQIQVARQQAKQQLSTYSNTFAGLKMTIYEDPEVLSIMNKTKQVMNDLNRTRMQELRQQTTRQNMFSNMAGWQSCQECHPSQFEFWKQTKHANAWQTLKKANQQYNQDCLICHVTLPTYDRGTVEKENLIARQTEEFHNVTCEACHGPGRNHADQPDTQKPRIPDEKTCLICHTPDHDTDFDYERKVRIIRCPSSEPVSR